MNIRKIQKIKRGGQEEMNDKVLALNYFDFVSTGFSMEDLRHYG